MPQTKEEIKEYNRLYRQKNKDKMNEQMRLYRLNENKQEKKEYNRLYHSENREKIKQKKMEWTQTEKGKKSHIISNWRYIGILCFDWDLLYDLFLKTTNCEFCNVELNTNTKTLKCLDHNHSIKDKFNVRGVLCLSCNIKDVYQ